MEFSESSPFSLRNRVWRRTVADSNYLRSIRLYKCVTYQHGYYIDNDTYIRLANPLIYQMRTLSYIIGIRRQSFEIRGRSRYYSRPKMKRATKWELKQSFI